MGFFTTVAAAAVFGTELVLLMDAAGIAAVFWIVATALWFVTFYGVLAVLTVKPDQPSLADGLNGGWLVSVVASQSAAMLTVLISAAGILTGHERPLLLAALVLWLGGGALYLWIMTLIFSRYTFYTWRRRISAPLLDQYGRGGDLRPGRRHAGRAC